MTAGFTLIGLGLAGPGLTRKRKNAQQSHKHEQYEAGLIPRFVLSVMLSVMCKKYMKSILAACLFFISMSANAGNTENLKKEIEHLLNFVKTSPCKLIRNGTEYDGPEAVDHIQKKYNYFKDQISTTEQFILLSATKSTMSGKSYLVQCGKSKPLKSQEWLLRELEKYREENRT